MRYVTNKSDESQYSQYVDKRIVHYFFSFKFYFVLFPLHGKRHC